jgi:hypothetical protein
MDIELIGHEKEKGYLISNMYVSIWTAPGAVYTFANAI